MSANQINRNCMSESYSNDTEIAKEISSEQKNTFRTRKDKNFVVINRLPLFDPNISLKAKGLWAFGMAHPDDWTFYIQEMRKHLNEGDRAIYSALDELIQNGYLCRLKYKIQLENRWVYGGCEYIFLETKNTPEQIDVIREELKKCFPHRRFADVDNVNVQNARLLKKESTKERKNNKYAPSNDDAQTPKKSIPKKEEKKERGVSFVDEEQYNSFKQKHGLLVSIADSQHQSLIEKHGSEITLKAYQYLAEWKLSKAETEPKSINKHTDYYRITKWVIKEIQNDQQRAEAKGITPEVEKNKEWAKKVDKVCSESSKFNAKYINVREDGIQFLLKSAINGEDCFVKCTDKGFIEICKNYLRKMGLT